MANFTGTSGNDNLVGTSGDDTFNMVQGGDDIVSGGDGTDTFTYGATFNANDQIDGGIGDDTLMLDGDYSAGVSFKANTLVNVENMVMAGGHSYTFVLAASTLVFGGQMSVDASALGASDVLHFNAAKILHGSFAITGGAGNDIITGGQSGNNFQLSQGGNDLVEGGGGQDSFVMGAAFTALDRLDGGGDPSADALYLDGDYSAGVTFKSTTMTNIDTIELTPGHSYTLTIAATTFAGNFGDVVGDSLGAGDRIIFDASAETGSRVQMLAGAGDDILTGGGGADIIDGGVSGADRMIGGAGDDSFDLHAGEVGARIDGGDGNDQLTLFDGFASGYVFRATTITSVENIVLFDGNSFKLTTNDANIAAGQSLNVDASQLTGTNTVTFNGVHETDGSFTFEGGAGNDILTGGALSDTFRLDHGGNDTVKGEGGDDQFDMLGAFNPEDRIDGGTGDDTVTLDGDYSASVVFQSGTIRNIDSIDLMAGHSYRLVTANQNVAAGQELRIDGTDLSSTDKLIFSGAKETDGFFTIIGGAGADNIVGGRGNDFIDGALGADKLAGGLGADTFAYNSAAESTSTAHDTIVDFDGAADKFDVAGVIGGVDTAITTGTLSTATFDADLTAAVDAGHLAIQHAVLFTANAGTLSGDTFLIIDQNGTAGYQANVDIVIQLTGAAHLNDLGTGNFV